MILAATLIAIFALCGITWRLTRPPAPAALIEQQYLDAQRQHAREVQLAEEYEMQAAVHRVRAASYESRVKRLAARRMDYDIQARREDSKSVKGAADALALRLQDEAVAELRKYASGGPLTPPSSSATMPAP